MKPTKKSARVLLGGLLGALAVASSILYVACDSSSDNAVKEPTPQNPDGSPVIVPDGAPPPDGAPLPDGAPSDCVMNPTTHLEIINACTDAVRIPKNPTLPLLLPDGGVPLLP